MVELLEGVPDIARAMSKGDQTKFWEDMAEHLNALGPPIRSGATWKRVWFDYKCAVKKKLRANKASLLATGGKFQEKPLNDVEERVANLTNLNATVEGNSARSFGIIPAPSIDQAFDNSSEQQQTNTEEQPEEQIATVPQAKKRRIKRKNTEEVLRQNQELLNLIKIQIEVQKESTAALKEATIASKAQI
ncbi:uncharacterized protein LOC128718244 [Anopheles marshallii]|uniref:uncharacterized protein LOC128718244 n=1 Tax=Anopheles marshallii TaxID=1521116 RepID=UPI00237B9D1C|nr:uncharacterized protein LOC128718244 [Anopheles marshallii]